MTGTSHCLLARGRHIFLPPRLAPEAPHIVEVFAATLWNKKRTNVDQMIFNLKSTTVYEVNYVHFV